jgi:outer membrane protein, heavy metal efflux system
MHRSIVWLTLLVAITGTCRSQTFKDTLTLSLPDAEKIFLQKNLALLSQQYTIDIKRALVQQSRLWDNPTLSTDQNMYDGKFFRHTTVNGTHYGQVYLQLQQVIITAGKRNKLVQLAKDETLTAEQQFNDLLRNLRYVLVTDYTNLYQLINTNSVYTNEIAVVQKLVAGMDAQLQAGNISVKDHVRVKALLYTLQSDQADVQRQLADVQRELRLLLQHNDTVFIVPVTTGINTPGNLTMTSLLDSARNNRPDLRMAQTNFLAQQHNLSYQQALTSPDVTVGIEYDHLNSYVPNYWGLTVGLPLPVFNRNQGNIKAARTAIQQAATGIVQVQTQAEQDVMAAYNKYLVAARLHENAGTDLGEKYDYLLQNMINSYRQRQVSLLEFIDFFEAYKEAGIRKYQQQAVLNNAAAELNFSTGCHIISFQ